jgi:segregation and condensation protein B
MNDLQSLVEALLFVTGEPLSPKEIAEVLSDSGRVSSKDIAEAIDELKAEYASSGRSFTVENIAGGYRLHTLPQFERWIAKLFKQPTKHRLSQPALETLAIIAYRQPITRVEIERVRGVNVDGVIKSLTDRGLITIRGRKAVAGRPYLYFTTTEFLEHFGLKSLDGLPMIEELRASISKTEKTTLEVSSSGAEGSEEENRQAGREDS